MSEAAPTTPTAIIQMLDEDGCLSNPRDADDVLDATALRDIYRQLVAARRLNEQAGALVRQGRLAVYPSSRGQEACQVACVRVLAADDWLFPTYRDAAAIVARGVDPVEVLSMLAGEWHCGYDPKRNRVAPQTTPLATQLLHAVGFAQAAQFKGEDTVVMALCGDGATSEGDFHEACNFAAVFRAPVVFLVQNNKYAISVPVASQSAAPSLASKAIGYGMPGVLVDGNDPVALDVVLRNAVERARLGHGPTLVEADTYRIDAHTNADDATRYRSDAEVATWVALDPLVRLRRYLRERMLLDDDIEAAVAEEAESMAADVRAKLAAGDTPGPDELFVHLYATMPAALLEQRLALGEELEFDEDAAEAR